MSKIISSRYMYPFVNSLDEGVATIPFWKNTPISSLCYDRIINAHAREIFAFLTDPKKISQWLAPKVSCDIAPGGIILFSWGHHGKITGEVISIEPPSFLEFIWEDSMSLETVVSFTLKESGSGTHLQLKHTLYGGATKWEWNDVHRSEWIFLLDNLCSVVETGKDMRREKAREDGWSWLTGSFQVAE